MLESLWQFLVGHRLERILHGVGFQLHDAVFFGTLVGTGIVVVMWMLRRTGAKDAANNWEQDMRKTAALAEREGLAQRDLLASKVWLLTRQSGGAETAEQD